MPKSVLPASLWTDPVQPPPLSIQTPSIRSLIQRLQTPLAVQSWINSLAYNKAETMRTIRGVVKYHKAHCLEASLAAATILEYHDWPPIILDLDSADNLGHTLFLHRHHGKFGTVGMSRDIGLSGRRPVYKTIRALVQSYAAPYIDRRALITGYAIFDLRRLKSRTWRTSNKNVWSVEQALLNLRHHKLPLSNTYIRRWRQAYLAFKKKNPTIQPTIYRHRKHWL